jgi:hypothetical protein
MVDFDQIKYQKKWIPFISSCTWISGLMTYMRALGKLPLWWACDSIVKKQIQC